MESVLRPLQTTPCSGLSSQLSVAHSSPSSKETPHAVTLSATTPYYEEDRAVQRWDVPEPDVIMTERLSKNGVHVRLVGARHHRQCYRCHHILHSPQVSRLSRTSAVDQVEKKKEGIQRIQAFKVELRRKKKASLFKEWKEWISCYSPLLLHPSPSPPATPPPPFANSLLLRYVRPEIVDKQHPHWDTGSPPNNATIITGCVLPQLLLHHGTNTWRPPPHTHILSMNL